MRRSLILIFVAITFAGAAGADPLSDDDALRLEILKADSIVFDRGFNKCDLAVYDWAIADDLEFYHDIGGATMGRAAFAEDFRNGICSSEFKPRRELVTDSVSVYPLRKDKAIYGAIETGDHKFFETPPGGEERQTGTAKFTILWLKQDEIWVMKNVLSYDHRALDNDQR